MKWCINGREVRNGWETRLLRTIAKRRCERCEKQVQWRNKCAHIVDCSRLESSDLLVLIQVILSGIRFSNVIPLLFVFVFVFVFVSELFLFFLTLFFPILQRQCERHIIRILPPLHHIVHQHVYKLRLDDIVTKLLCLQQC